LSLSGYTTTAGSCFVESMRMRTRSSVRFLTWFAPSEHRRVELWPEAGVPGAVALRIIFVVLDVELVQVDATQKP
jgi:hypothetical protein